MNPTYIIAEIGINHNGSMDIAKKLIDVAAFAGCNAVKFQKRNPILCVPEHQKNQPKDTPWGQMTYLEYKDRMEFSQIQYDCIDKHCKDKGISWSASPWDLDSLKFLNQYDVPFIKIPSAMLTNYKLLQASCDTGKQIILSTGMSTVQEIDQAVEILQRNTKDFVILHCNSSYPAALEDLNLQCIKTLKTRYGCKTGYSGHEFRLGTSVAAIYLGATMIERHITLDRSMWGSDHLASVEPQGLIKLVKGIRELEIALGNGKIEITDSELKPRKKLRGY
jgi:N-acetylneuraminate synthase